MAINKKHALLILVVCFCLPFVIIGHPLMACKFDSIYQFGDSISDTGNLIQELPFVSFAKLPYGQNFEKGPTGRCSNGRVMSDFIATAAGLPLLEPYENKQSDFSHGVNFAVAGSTALPWEVFASEGIFSLMTRSSLNVQLDWMSLYLSSTCFDHTSCAEKLKRALFILGETGGNDYNLEIFKLIFEGKTWDDLRPKVPQVVDTILNSVRRVISLGAKFVVVPGNFAIGCFPVYKAAFETNNSTEYDENNCLKKPNKFSRYHNTKLQQGIRKMIKEENPNATIVYASYYKAYEYLLNVSKSHGFDTERACCGFAGSNYNYRGDKMCGADDPQIQICKNPDEYVSWDGVHLTQEGYKIMAQWLTIKLSTKLHCNHTRV